MTGTIGLPNWCGATRKNVLIAGTTFVFALVVILVSWPRPRPKHLVLGMGMTEAEVVAASENCEEIFELKGGDTSLWPGRKFLRLEVEKLTFIGRSPGQELTFLPELLAVGTLDDRVVKFEFLMGPSPYGDWPISHFVTKLTTEGFTGLDGQSVEEAIEGAVQRARRWGWSPTNREPLTTTGRVALQRADTVLALDTVFVERGFDDEIGFSEINVEGWSLWCCDPISGERLDWLPPLPSNGRGFGKVVIENQ